MNSGDESPRPAEAPGAPTEGDPTPEVVLGWIAAAAPGPWFPSIHVKQTGILRDRLDAPLNTLRLADLIRISTWERGIGQGYTTTPLGAEAVSQAAASLLEGSPGQVEPAAGTAVPAPRAALLDERPPLATPALLVVNLIWFMLGLVIAWRQDVPIGTYLSSGDPLVLDRLGAASAVRLIQGDWWRLFACCFVHVGFWHLLMNMIGLLVVGPVAELFWGRWRVLAIYLLAGLGGSCLAMALRPLDPDSGAPLMLAGASGAIWGVMGSLAAWLLLYRRRLSRNSEFDREFAGDFTRRLGFAFVLNVAISFLPGVSWEAHAGGGVVGFVAAALLHACRTGRRPRRIAASFLVLALPFVCLTGLAFAMSRSEAWRPLRDRLADAQHRVDEQAERQPHVQAIASAVNAVHGLAEAARTALTAQELVSQINAISPEAVRPVEAQAVLVLSKEPDRRRPDEVAELRSRVASLLMAATQLAHQFTTATGDAAIDANRANVRAFAEARIQSLRLLDKMIESKSPPGEQAWQEWGETKREVDRRWMELIAAGTKPKEPGAAPPP